MHLKGRSREQIPNSPKSLHPHQNPLLSTLNKGAVARPGVLEKGCVREWSAQGQRWHSVEGWGAPGLQLDPEQVSRAGLKQFGGALGWDWVTQDPE